MMTTFNVSVLICARNEEKTIPSLLVALANQTFKQHIREILIADNQSTDKTFESVKAIAETYELPVKIFQFQSNNLGWSRNFLVEQAQSDYLAFIDADCKVNPNWLQLLISHLSCQSKFNSEVAGVGGPNRLPDNNLFQKMINRNLDWGFLHGFSAQSFKPQKNQWTQTDHLATTNALFVKKCIVEVGNFSPLFENVGEDLDLGLRLNKNSKQLLLFESPMVINDSAQTLGTWASRMFRFGKAQGLTFGRRWAFVTWAIVAFSALTMTLIFATTWIQLACFIAWVAMSFVVCRPIKLKKKNLKFLMKWVYSYLLAIVTLQTTVVSYSTGFYIGLFQRLFRWKHNQSPATSIT